MSTKSTRFHLIDLLRLLVYFAIAGYHFQEIVWFNLGYPLSKDSSVWSFIEAYDRTFVIGGQIILFLTFFLIGYREKSFSKNKKIYLGSFAATFLFFALEYKYNETFFVWDIYPLIALSALMLIGLEKLGLRVLYYFASVGMVLLSIDIWKYLSLKELPFFLRTALVGDCDLLYGDWPILPWIGLSWVAFAAGKYCFYNLEKVEKNFSKIETVFWLLMAYPIFKYINHYRDYGVDTDGWACFTFRQDFYIFFLNMLPWLFIMRIALIKSIRNQIESSKFLNFVSNLNFSLNFGIYYCLHYTYLIVIYMLFGKKYENDPFWAMVVFLTSFVVTELVVKGISSFYQKVRLKNRVN